MKKRIVVLFTAALICGVGAGTSYSYLTGNDDIKNVFQVSEVEITIEEEFVPVDDYSRLELLEFVQQQNLKAWQVMLVWLLGNGVVGLLYSARVLDNADLSMHRLLP